jgi:hypothetical protein
MHRRPFCGRYTAIDGRQLSPGDRADSIASANDVASKGFFRNPTAPSCFARSRKSRILARGNEDDGCRCGCNHVLQTFGDHEYVSSPRETSACSLRRNKQQFRLHGDFGALGGVAVQFI